MPDAWESISWSGVAATYKLQPKPSATGGQASVFSAEHRETGLRVAYKRLKSRTADPLARLRREIDVGRQFGHELNVMPVLDGNDEEGWLVMPWADATLSQHANTVTTDPQLRLLIEQIAAGLSPAHTVGWIHRDIKPSNILVLERAGTARWVVADWGLVRRPPADSTQGNRTRTGTSLGTFGFAAPELSTSAHTARPTADVYSLGQIIGHLLTGRSPAANQPLLPTEEPWRTIVRAATQPDPLRRPQTMAKLLDVVAISFATAPLDLVDVGNELAVRAQAGDVQAAVDLLVKVEANPENEELCIDIAPLIPGEIACAAAKAVPATARAVATAIESHLDMGWHRRQYAQANAVILLPLHFVEAGIEIGDLDLVAEGLSAALAWDGRFDQWDAQRRISTLLRDLPEFLVGTAAAALGIHHLSAAHLADLIDDRRVHQSIRGRIRAANGSAT